MSTDSPKTLFNKNSLLLIQGTIVSRFGDVLYSIVIGYYVLQITDSKALMGVFTSLSMFVTMFLSPLTGAIVDRISRKFIIVTMDLLRGVLMLLIGYLCLQANLQLNVLIVLTVLIALSSVLFQPAASTVLIDIVPKTEFVRANSIVTMLSGGMDLISKAVSGFLLLYFSIAHLIIFNGLSFLFSAITKYYIAIPKTPKQGSRLSLPVIFSDLLSGLLTLLKTKGLNVIFCLGIVINLCGAGIVTMLLLINLEKGFNLQQHGLILSFISLGALLGTMITSLFKFPDKVRPKMMIAGFLFGELFFVLALIFRSFAIVTACFFSGHLANMIGNMILNSSYLIIIPENQRATILGFIFTSSIGGQALSTIVYGWLAELYPVSLIGIVGTLLGVVAILLMVFNKEVIKAVVASGGET